MQTLKPVEKPTPRLSPTSHKLLIAKFIALWILTLAVLAAVALLRDINWMRPHVEKVVNQTLSRNVKLGKLTWGIGLNGLNVETDKVGVWDKNGEPLFVSRHASFGLAILPMFSGRFRLKHLDFDEAQVFLIKTGPEPTDWNFEDLLHIENTDVDLIQFKRGSVRVIPQAPAKAVDFKDVRLLINSPRKGKNLPFFFSGTHEGIGHVSKIRLEGFILKQGVDSHDLNFVLNSTNLTTREISQFASIFNTKLAKELEDEKVLNQLPKAVMNLKVEGKGNTTKGIRAFIDMSTPTLSVAVNNYGIKSIDTKEAKGKATVDLDDKKIAWKDMKFKFSAIELNSSGELHNWQRTEATVQATVLGKLKSPSTNDLTIKPLNAKQKMVPASLSGQAFMTIKIHGKAQNAIARTEIKSEDLVMKEFVQKLLAQFPILSSVGLMPQSKMSGKVTIDNANVAKLEYGELRVHNTRGGDGKVTAKGWIDLNRNVFDFDHGKGHFDIEAKSIDLRQASDNFQANKQAAAQLTRMLKLPGTKFELAGSVDSKLNVDLTGSDYHVVGTSSLRRAGLSLQNKLLEVSDVTGDVQLDARKNGGTIKLVGFKGKMGKGDFQLDGNMTIEQNPVVDISFHATSFDLRHLSSLITMFKVDLPIFTERQLYGSVKDVRLRISGMADNPKIYFSAIPDDLYYQPPGLANPLETVDGSIVYNEDSLILDDIDIISHNNTIAVDLYIKDLSTACILQRVRAKTDKIELADIHYYLMSTAMPGPLRKAYHDLLQTYGIVGPYGKIFGEVLYSQDGKGDGQESIDGIVGCYKAGASISKLPLYEVAGVMAFSDDDLLFNDLQGRVKGSRFNLDGFVKEYRSKKPFWESQIEMTLVPSEILQLVPRLSQVLKEQKIDIKSDGVISLKSIVKGSKEKNTAEVSLLADHDNNLMVSGPFGEIHQPPGKDIKLEGKVTLEPERIFIDTSNILVGETLMTIKAEVLDKDKDKSTSPDIDITFGIPKKASIATLISILNPPLAKNTSGEIQGEVSAKGPLDHPLIDGQMNIKNLNLPAFDVKNLSGKIEANQTVRDSLKGNKSNANVFAMSLDSLMVKDLSVTDLNARLALEAKSKKSNLLRLSIKEGTAKLAGGSVEFTGWADTTDNSMYLKSSAKDVSAQVVSEKVFGVQNEITGDVKANLELKTKGANYEETMSNLSGKGQIVFQNGLVSRFGDLETRLTQYNLLTQGIFGFNLNNLLQSVWPVRSGQYSELSTRFNIANQVVKINEIKFSGTDMRLWGLGKADLKKNKIDMEIAGRIPRVTQSMLGGEVGKLSRNLTLQKALKVATFGKLQNLPTLPVIGAIATDKPRTFEFNISAPLDKPKTIAKTIEKSFKWLPNLPQATAHPIPGIETTAPSAESLQ